MRSALLLTAVVFLAGCHKPGDGSDPDAPGPSAAIDIELVQDPNINSTQQLLEQINTVVLVVDSEEGLYEPGEEVVDEVFEVRDADNDPADLELVSTIAVDGEIPPIRLERGGLPEVPINIRVFGGREGQAETSPIAEGAALGVAFDSEARTISIPFNIRPEQLPPRVVSVIPNDGDIAHFCRLIEVVILFSKPMDEQSLLAEGAFQIGPIGDISGIVSFGDWRVVELQIVDFSLPGEQALSYELDISPNVADREGVTLDQNPAQQGRQGYQAELNLECRDIPVEPIPWELRCRPDNLDGLCEHGRMLGCIDGQCALDHCERVPCPGGYVCGPSVGCQPDCRLYGDASICPSVTPTCSLETGLCEG